MKKIKEFVKEHTKKIIGGTALTVITLGIYGVFKIVKHKKES